MRHITFPALSLILMTGAAAAQSVDMSNLYSVDDADVMGPDGNKIGEIEEILVDVTGIPVAAVVEAGGFLDIGDEDIVVSLEDLTFDAGNYSTLLTEEELEDLPEWDD